jgi:hypothetical protein
MAGKEKEGGSFGREAGGLAAEVAGSIALGVGLLSWEGATILAGGVLFLIGSWVRNSGK